MKLLILEAKHGDFHVLARDENEEREAWLAMFMISETCEFYHGLTEPDEIILYNQALQGNALAAKYFLQFRGDYEYERIYLEDIETPNDVFERLKKNERCQD